MGDNTSITAKAKVAIVQRELADFPAPAKEAGVMLAAMDAGPETIIRTVVGLTDAMEAQDAERDTPLQRQPDDYTDIEKAIADMLTENTGVSMFDSGGVYGRRWQANRAVADLRKAEPVSVRFDYGGKEEGAIINVNVFHFLTERLWIDEHSTELQKRFDRFCEKQDVREMSWPATVDGFIKELRKDGYVYVLGENTYNRDSVLSQVLQYNVVEKSRNNGMRNGHRSTVTEEYVFLQVHNGCDVRGGYTAPKVFCCQPDEELFEPIVSAHCKCGYADEEAAGYYWYTYSDGLTIKEHGLPEEWELKGDTLTCTVCKETVKFYAGE